MKVAVTGGTGFVGSAVVEELVRSGHEVRVLSRISPKEPLDHVRYLKGSVVTGEGLDAFLEGSEAVVHLVGIIREKGANTFRAVHHQGTVNVLLAASKAGIRRYLHMSALGTRPEAKSVYHQTKWNGEEAVRVSGLDWTIFRPSIIFGPHDAFVNMLAQMMRRTPLFPVIGGGKGKMQPVFIKDVAASFNEVLQSDRYVGKTYELGGPDIYNLKQLLKTVAQVIGKKQIYITVPIPLILPAVYLAQVFKIPIPVTTDQIIMLGEDNIRSGGDPVEELGLNWTPFEEGIKGYLQTGSE